MLPPPDQPWHATEAADHVAELPDWDRRADLVGRAMRLIADGVVDREGVPGLARRLGHPERHIHRQLVAAVGAGPLALARAQRVRTARMLLETTSLPISEVALAAGFGSVRQLGDTVREVFGATPGALRANARDSPARPGRQQPGREGDGAALVLRLPYRAPFEGAALIGFLARRAIPGVEEAIGGCYRRSVRLPRGPAVVELAPGDGHVVARLWLADLRDLGTAIYRSRALMDLDSDPHAVARTLGRDELLGALVRRAPGRRVPGPMDPDELAIRAVLGQQVSLAGAATLAGRLVAGYGEPLERPLGAVTHVFPSAAAIAAVDPARLAMPAGRRRALLSLAAALASGELVLDAGADRDEARRRLLALPGIGPWTADYIAVRALRDADAFLASDLGVRHALEGLGCDGRPPSAERLAEGWRPYRAYALQYLCGQHFPRRTAADRRGPPRTGVRGRGSPPDQRFSRNQTPYLSGGYCADPGMTAGAATGMISTDL